MHCSIRTSLNWEGGEGGRKSNHGIRYTRGRGSGEGGGNDVLLITITIVERGGKEG